MTATHHAELKTWQQRVLEAHPRSDPEHWPDELKAKYMQLEIAELRASIEAKRSVPNGAKIPVETCSLLAKKHTGMRVDYSGMLRQARQGLRREPALAEMLRQLSDHMKELGSRWYEGDTAVVDEILQLYCVESHRRNALNVSGEKQCVQ